MTSVLVYVSGRAAPVLQAADLEFAGLQALAWVDGRHKLVHEAIRHAPDLVICDAARPDDALFRTIRALAETAACPVLVLASEAGAERITEAVESGVHAYVVNGYSRERLRSLAQLAQARFRQEQGLRKALEDVSTRLEERKTVDRAKLILMRARQLSDDDAFRLLRTASMHSNQRLGQVSEHIIHSARYAEGVNRAGQLRMLSQRLVLLYVLQWLHPQGDGPAALPYRQQLRESVLRIDANLDFLGKGFSRPAFGDLVEQVGKDWQRLKNTLQTAPPASEMAELDERAEQLLQNAERLTASLENAGAIAPLQVLNIAGRQRMLSQRFAKLALLATLGDEALAGRSSAALQDSRHALDQALAYLHRIPLSTPDIRRRLEAGTQGWQQMQQGASQARTAGGQLQLAQASEALLEVFESLSALYEHSMQMLMG